MFGWFSEASTFGFALEARQAIGIARERLGRILMRDVAIQLRVARAIDLAHPAFADRRGDFVDAETSADRESQTVGLYGRSGSADRITPR